MNSGVLTPEEVDVVGRKGSEDTKIDVQTHLEASLGTSLENACFNDEACFLVKSNF